jgi:hypothetical protein
MAQASRLSSLKAARWLLSFTEIVDDQRGLVKSPAALGVIIRESG